MNEYQFCKDDWKIAARNIFLCVIGVVILTPITMFFASLSSISLMLDAMGKSVGESASWPNTAAAISGVLLLGLLVWYIISLSKFKNNQISDESSSAVGTLRTCVIVQFAGVLIFLLSIISPVVGSVLFFLWCIALIIMQFIIKDACKTLSEEETWSKVARRGASQLKTSVAYTIYGMFAPILWFLLFVLTNLLVAGSKDMSWQVIIYDLAQGNYTAYLLPFFVLLICGLVQIYWGVMSFVLMLLGWNNIQSGTLVDPSEKEAKVASRQTNVSEQSASNAVQEQNVQTPSFCPECGVKLAPGSKFCPSCGKSLLMVAAVTEQQTESIEMVAECDTTSDAKEEVPPSEPIQKHTFAIISTPAAESAPEYYDTDEDTTENRTRKWWLYGGIAAGVVVLGVILWFLFSGDKMPDGPKSFVFAPSATVYMSVDDWNGSDPICELEFGDSVVTFDMDPTQTWIKVASHKSGKSISGYVDITKLMDRDAFVTLKARGGFENESVRLAITENYERRALAQKLSELGQDWELLTTDFGYGLHPMVLSSYIDGLSPKGVGFAFLVINKQNKEKHLYLYTYDDDNNPVFVYDEPVKEKWVGISEIKIKRGRVKVTYFEDELDSDSDDYAEQYIDDHTAVFKGMIDGKYPITMRLMVMGIDVSGSYYYDKYKTEIPLTGEISFNEDGDKTVTLTETNDGVMTGQFIGTWRFNSFSGSWISADGEKEMNFSLSL